MSALAELGPVNGGKAMSLWSALATTNGKAEGCIQTGFPAFEFDRVEHRPNLPDGYLLCALTKSPPKPDEIQVNLHEFG